MGKNGHFCTLNARKILNIENMENPLHNFLNIITKMLLTNFHCIWRFPWRLVLFWNLSQGTVFQEKMSEILYKSPFFGKISNFQWHSLISIKNIHANGELCEKSEQKGQNCGFEGYFNILPHMQIPYYLYRENRQNLCRRHILKRLYLSQKLKLEGLWYLFGKQKERRKR